MTNERWERLNHIFHAATALDSHERRTYLDEACGDDVELRGEAERLVRAHAAVTRNERQKLSTTEHAATRKASARQILGGG